MLSEIKTDTTNLGWSASFFSFSLPSVYRVVGGGIVTRLCWTFATSWIGACQAPLSLGFSRQEYWSGLPFPPPGNLPDPGIDPGSPGLLH